MLLVALCGLARAADFSKMIQPQVVRQGFSRDARYHLLLTSWIQDGSGFPAATLQITDVRRNAAIYRRQHIWKQDGVSAARRTALVNTWRTGQLGSLKRYHLTAPIAGERLFKVAPQPGYPSTAPISTLTKAGTFTLTSLPLASKCTFSDRPTLGLALTLGGRELQRDTRLPASRGCASGYRLETAYRYKSGLAVIVRTFLPGFGGPDAVPLVVTAELK